MALRGILDRYCAVSGQKVSEGKSSIFFSGNTEVEVKALVCETLNVMTESLNDKYLGLPALVGADRSDCFWHLVERVRARRWLEGKVVESGREGNSHQIDCSSNTSICDDGVQAPSENLQRSY